MGGIFISYARDDNKPPFVEKLCADLKNNRGFSNVWFDKKSMNSRGRTFLHEIRDAICDSERVIAVVGPNALKSKYVWYEWEYAYLMSKVLVPVLRKGDYDSISEKQVSLLCRDYYEKFPYELSPSDMASHHIIDFRQGRPYDEALDELVNSLRKSIKKLGTVHTDVPELVPNFVPRSEEFDTLKKLVISDPKDPRVIKSTKRITALHGREGIGKTVMAAAFAHSVNIRRSFDDGIIWLQMGKAPKLREKLETVGNAFHDNSLNYVDLDTARNALEGLLEEKECLIILDDVCDCSHVQIFYDNLGPNCRLLFTTRYEELGIRVGAQIHTLDVLRDRDALQLLADWSGEEVDSLPSAAKEIAKKCDNLPFALAHCGGTAQSGQPWTDILEALLEVDHATLKGKFPGWEGEIDVFTPLQISLDILKKMDEDERKDKKLCLERYKHYLGLSVLPSGERTSESVIMTLWMNMNGLKERHLRRVLRRLRNMDLVKTYGESPLSQVSLHNLQQIYLRSLVENLAELHKVIGRALLGWWQEYKYKSKTKDEEEKQIEKYVLNHLFSHLVDAKQWDDLKELLTDMEYLRRKQEPSEQFDFQSEFISFLRLFRENDKLPPEKHFDINDLVDILETLHGFLKKLRHGKTKADLLDIFAFWIDKAQDEVEYDQEWSSALKAATRTFSHTCGEVSLKLAGDYLKKREYDWALRFAELATWTYERASEYENCKDACCFAETMCREMKGAYRKLGLTEFVRMHAHALAKLTESETDKSKKECKALAREAYDDLDQAFSKMNAGDWRLTIKDWKKLEKDTEEDTGELPKLPLPDKLPRDFKALVVSNAHDCISAMYIIQFFRKRGGLVEWVHHKKFKLKQFAPKDTLVTVLIGSAKARGISSVTKKFYEKDKDRFLRMYSGCYFEAHCIEITEEKTNCYMIGGPSKVNTLMAAYEFTKNPKVKRLIAKQKKLNKRKR